MRRRVALWYFAIPIVCLPLFATAQGLVPCSGLNCRLCDLAALAQNIINFLIGLSIPIVACLFAYAGFLYATSAASPANIDTAKNIFKQVLFGFLFVLGCWLIIQTVLKVALNSSYNNWNTIQCNDNRPMQSQPSDLLSQVSPVQAPIEVSPTPGYLAQPGGPQLVAPAGGGCDSYLGVCWDANNNVVDAKSGSIANAASLYYGTNTSAGPDNGNLACAWAVNNVLQSAGVAPIDGASVSGMEQALENGRGTPIDTTSAQPGDIIVWKSDTVSHVGICQNAGCSSAISNSSANASFTNVSGSTLMGVPGRVYHVNK
ncbi:MAG: hypothetical protein KGI70_00335 [Patescibacteria group bacterium]|nr:hypothetical protein [Patescibacteria group bacterium]